MTRSTLYTQLFSMLSDMTVENGYSRTYTPVKSVNNETATMKQTPFISLHIGYEEAVDEGVGFNEERAVVPITITARITAPHALKHDIEYEYDIERSECIADIKRRFWNAWREVDGCARLMGNGEQEPRIDSNKSCLYVEYEYLLDYKTQN